MKKLELEHILSSALCKEANLALAMIAPRLLSPCSKRATLKQRDSTTLLEELCITDVTVKDLYSAMDLLLKRQVKIEKKLADRHLSPEEGQNHTLLLYDISNSSYYGDLCPLVKYGYSRDNMKLSQIVYGVLTNKDGCPISADVYEPNQEVA